MDRKTEQRERAHEAYQRKMKSITDVALLLSKRPREEIDEYEAPLSWDERKEIDITLSWGGPSDGFKLYTDQDGMISEGYYYFSDWFTYDEFRLTDAELDCVLSVYPVHDN